MFGRRKREQEAAAEAAREAERHALFARLAERPEHICPFLGLEADRTGYVQGVSDDHRCYAFGDPAPISAEQQTRVCEERGYGNCPRYLRGVLVIPTEELEALRRPRAPIERPSAPAATAVTEPRRRRRAPILALLLLLLLVGGGAVGAYFLFGPELGVGGEPTSQATPTAQPSPTVAPTPSPTVQPTATPIASTAPPTSGSPTPEPTPDAGDAFAFYEVSVAPSDYTLYPFDADVAGEGRTVAFDQFSFARVEPLQGQDGAVYWVTQDGDLADFAYRYPDSGDFRIRAVFLNEVGDRRSVYLEDDRLTELPEATPAP